MAGSARGTRPLRDHPAPVWFALGLLVALAGAWSPGLGWAAIHLVVLGGATLSILVWSSHFTQALLKTRATRADERAQDRRIVLHIVGTLLVIGGVMTVRWPVTIAGAALVSAAVGWHGATLMRDVRAALPGRFRITVRYYVGAALLLPVGAVFGVLLAHGPDETGEGRLLLAHTVTMLLGWIGLTMCGTLVTLWPTMLRTRLDPRAESLARHALPVLMAGVLVTDAAALLAPSPRWAGIGLLGYVAAVLWWARALVLPARTAPPRHAATWSTAAALGWFAATLVLVLVRVATTPAWAELPDGYPTAAIAAVVGFAAQLLIGALSHLVPVVIGGGARAVRAGQGVMDRYAVARVLAANLGLVVWLGPVPGFVQRAGAAVCLLALGSFLALMPAALLTALREKASRATQPPLTKAERLPRDPGIWSARQALAAVIALALVVGAAVVWHGSDRPHAPVTASGRTTRVTVEAVGMAFRPDRIVLPAGDRLVVDLVNRDPTSPHDLVLANGVDSGRVMPGGRATVDAGVIDTDLDGWCSIVGHRQMGMTLRVAVTGTSANPPPTSGVPANAGSTPPTQADPSVPGSFRAVDPRLPALTDSEIHRVTLTVQERTLEVAPGVRQKRWTYNGGVPGPTLHGRIGDTFVVTLVNRSTMGHSIDFHAGSVAPDLPMRTIPPGASLTYRFTATRAGIWMYHCATMPMSAHIAAGLYGAVVIDPPGLAPVAASYVLEEGAAYVGGDGRTTIAEVDADAVLARRPSFLTLNGVAYQYDHRPIDIPVGQRIRVWLLAAGPDAALSFHVIGGQFDTTYAEGAYLLKDGRDAFGERGGGAQALALQPGQGGFVEFTLPEAGTYPFTSHVMTDAERGAHGRFVAR